MEIQVPEIIELIPSMLATTSSFKNDTKPISDWVEAHRLEQKRGMEMVDSSDETYQIKILCNFVGNLLVRAMRGESGEKVLKALSKNIRKKEDLNDDVYKRLLAEAGYRWGIDSGVEVIQQTVNYFGNELKWNWKRYFLMAEEAKISNFKDDRILDIKNVSYKVRDLALSCYNKNYVAIDLHVAKILARLGLINYGYDLLDDPNIEIGTNPADAKQYLFLHRLILKLSEKMNGEYSPSDIDRIFWHYGRSVCKAKPRCDSCKLNGLCMSGRGRLI